MMSSTNISILIKYFNMKKCNVTLDMYDMPADSMVD